MKEIKLGDLFLKKGGSVDPAKFPEETFEYYSIPAYDKGIPEIIKGSGIGSSKKLFQPNDILLSRIVPHIRRCWVVGSSNGKRQIGSGEWITFRSDKIIPEFLRFYLMSDEFNAKFLKTVKGVGGSLLRADPQQVAKFSINLPPLDQQKKIADILDAADAYRQKTKALIAKYDELIQSLFLDMFGDISCNIKFEIGVVGDLVTIVRDGPHVSPQYSESGIPILSTRNIRPFQLVMDEVKYVSEDMFQELTKKFKPKRGDLLLTKGGTTGFAKVVDWDWDFCIWVHLAALRINTIKAHPKYLEAALNSHFGYQQSQRYTRGIANKDLGLQRMIKIELPIPPLEIQNQFAERVQAIEEQKAQAQAGLEKAEELFNSLLQRAFKGELV